MFTSRNFNTVLKSIREEALRLVYIDYDICFDKIMEGNKQKRHSKKILNP